MDENSIEKMLLEIMDDPKKETGRAITKRISQKVENTTIEAWCSFCKTNGEAKSFYSNHSLKINGSIVCPVLYKYVCPICHKTGKEAHTIKYCPLNEGKISFADTLKTIRKSNGQRR